ncbi:MAG TPA: ferritin family protein [Dehalococcoidia bacterium]|nr:ferritin family protein [Dehalococcoidia bacterium]
MRDEVTELLDTAIYKEIASQAFYIAGQEKTDDSGARLLMEELAQEELKHARWLEALKEKGLDSQDCQRDKVPNLMISEYLSGGDSLDGAGVQDTLLFAMKREQQSVDFYSRMMGIIKDETARSLCARLMREELKHKLKLETLYDDMMAGAED